MSFTHINHGFVFEELEAETTEEMRTYEVPDGYGGKKKYPSVTTVLGFDKKEFFAEWRNIPGNRLKSEKALERGNIIHDAIENYLNNDSKAIDHIKDLEFRAMTKSMRKALHNIDNIHALEVPLYSHNLNLAGRVDCVGEYNGKLSIIDFKGSTKTKQEKYIENYFMQATAYSIMWEELTGQRIDNLVIIMGNEDGFCQVFEKSVHDYVPRLMRKLIQYDQHIQLKEKEICEK